jgi:uncharacterized protein YcgI (DUF1989 family)
MSGRSTLNEWILEPGTGKAIELRVGQILRIEQVEGCQCADFNASTCTITKSSCNAAAPVPCTASTRRRGFLWSAPPRELAMLYILEDTVGRNDVLFPRCSAYVYESAYGFDVHTNCHDIQAEAQREYGLPPRRCARQLQFLHVHGGVDRRPRDHHASDYPRRCCSAPRCCCCGNASCAAQVCRV